MVPQMKSCEWIGNLTTHLTGHVISKELGFKLIHDMLEKKGAVQCIFMIACALLFT